MEFCWWCVLKWIYTKNYSNKIARPHTPVVISWCNVSPCNACHWHLPQPWCYFAAQCIPVWCLTAMSPMTSPPTMLPFHGAASPCNICQQQQCLPPWGMASHDARHLPPQCLSPLRYGISSWHEAMVISATLPSLSMILCLTLQCHPCEVWCLIVHPLPTTLSACNFSSSMLLLYDISPPLCLCCLPLWNLSMTARSLPLRHDVLQGAMHLPPRHPIHGKTIWIPQ